MSAVRDGAAPIPARAGIGVRGPHYRELLERRPAVGFLEAHSENYFGAGGAPLLYLERLREEYPLSLHGVGLSLGSADPLSCDHLAKLQSLIQRFRPTLVSEHLSWSSVGGIYLNDLLPLPYTEESLDHCVSRVSQVQDTLGVRLLVENPSSYLGFAHSTIDEWDFVAEVARRSGCGLLLDINNVYVSACNHGYDPLRYLRAIPTQLVGEIHLAGFTRNERGDREILIDSHGAPVSPAVWSLFEEVAGRFSQVPVLIEWDTDIPALDVLLAEAARADRILEAHRAVSV